MSWQEVSILALKSEFVLFAQQESCNFSELCARFNISRKTGYKWLDRFKESGAAGLVDQSRRPHNSPSKTEASVEDAVVALRGQHETWGGRKLRRRMTDLGHEEVPAASTITDILRRRGLIDPLESLKHQPLGSFEHPHPNDLWQMDFKGHFMTRRRRCHPLTILDDHSRFDVLLKACADETTATVQQALIETFRRYGLPNRITMDNGSPWGNDAFTGLTQLTVWIVRVGVAVSHSRPYHPQTQGKDERFHRTLGEDCISKAVFADLDECQRAFDRFRDIYNLERPHEALGLDTPITRYEPSQRPYPEVLPQIEYWPGDAVRKVQENGDVHFKGRIFRLSKALRGQPVAFRETAQDGKFSIHFCNQKLREVHMSEAAE
ncbi:IS481 family transposase [Geomonas sp. RF6]|uniref:IS481 family transposase n=1 Tax=Geomonas sp. RF6 TaxID=2897342 RepID=UPI001E3774C4|nr:IS481 family transposase [Geomonas sp. RF6]UFS71478.1 IS481 family transposase [Geomonas sp. RF6]